LLPPVPVWNKDRENVKEGNIQDLDVEDVVIQV